MCGLVIAEDFHSFIKNPNRYMEVKKAYIYLMHVQFIQTGFENTTEDSYTRCQKNLFK